MCRASELGPGESRIVETNQGRSIGVFNVDGEYHAILNICLHQNGPLCEGDVERKIVGEFVDIGQRVQEKYADEHVIKCPWHGWEYELETGDLVHDERMSLPVFDVVVDDGIVYITA